MFPNKELKIIIPVLHFCNFEMPTKLADKSNKNNSYNELEKCVVLKQTNITKYTVKSPLNISSQANASLIKTNSSVSNPFHSSSPLGLEMSAKIFSVPYPSCEYVLHFDGCSKGNPGPAGIGAVISKSGKEEWCGCQFIGKKTNNQSEYSALILGLKEALNRDIKQLQVYGDSLLVINQVTGQFKVKNIQLQELYKEAIDLIAKFDYIVFNHVYREFNKRADQLSNLGLELCDS
jgi:ribonuclease HI